LRLRAYSVISWYPNIRIIFPCTDKNKCYTDSVAGAEAGAAIFSLIETCKHHGIEAYDWLRYVLEKMPSCQLDDEIEALLPFNIDRSLIDR
jgi:transposase